MERLAKFNFRQQERKIVIIFIVSFLLYALFIIVGDVNKVLSLGTDFNWWLILPMVFLSFCSYFFRSLRFYFLLQIARMPLGFVKAFNIFFAGITMTVTPGKTGEIIKSYLIKKQAGYGYSRTVPIVVFERVTDAIAMIILSLGGLYLFRRALIFYLFFSLLVLVFLSLVCFRRKIILLIGKFEKRFHLKIIEFVRVFLEGSQRLLTSKTLSVSILLSLIAWGLQAGSLLLLLYQFPSVGASLPWFKSLLYALFIFCFSSIAGFLVMIPAGIGLSEGSIISFLILFFHLTLAEAVFISLIFRLATLWFGVGLGMVFLVQTLKRVR